MLDDLRDRFAVVLFGILNLPANLSGGFSFPDHWHVSRRQMPVGRAGRHVQSRDVLFLVASSALLPIKTLSIRSPPHVLGVNVSVITLSGIITRCMAIETARMFEHRNDRDEKLASE